MVHFRKLTRTYSYIVHLHTSTLGRHPPFQTNRRYRSSRPRVLRRHPRLSLPRLPFCLPLSPSSTWLRMCYDAQLFQEVRVPMGLPDRWDTCFRTIYVQDRSFSFAYWGDTISVGLVSGDVASFDAVTGVRVALLPGDTGRILSLAFSLDGTLLVSGSEGGIVSVWVVQTDQVIKTFKDHPSAILAVSVSPDHTTVASGTEDGTVRLWDLRTGECNPFAMCHDDRITAISFSPTDPRRLISSSMDGTSDQSYLSRSSQCGPRFLLIGRKSFRLVWRNSRCRSRFRVWSGGGYT